MEQTDRPDRKVYHITPAGHEALHQWLQGPAPIEEARSAPLIQVFFAGQLTDEEILAKFEELTTLLRGMLARYNEVPARISEYTEMVNSPRETFFWMLTLDMGITLAEAQLKWAEGVIHRIKNKEHPAQ